VVGVVGENGSGKSTTMNLLTGVLQRDGGRVLLDGIPYAPRSRRESDGAGVAFIQQELSLFPNLTVAENLFLGRFPRRFKCLPIISYKKMYTHAREVLRDVGLDIDPRFDTSAASSGERQLLEIARSLSSEARLIIFDEPTTSLTQREADRLFEIIGRLRARGVTIIYISHDLEDVIRLSDRIVVMRDGQVTLRTASVNTTVHDLVVAMVGRSIGTLFQSRSHPSNCAQSMLEVEGVGEPGVVDGVSFRVGRGEIVGVAGLMGSGRSELARILFGIDPHRRGRVAVAGKALRSADLSARIAAGVAFLTEDRRHEGLMMDASVAENMALAALPLFATRPQGRIRDKSLMRAMQALAAQLCLKCGSLSSTIVRTLSGGNQQKVVLGRWLLRKPLLFILDEPTRGVDVGAKEEIYHLLAQMAEEGMAVLIISSEIEELMGLCDRILVMHRGRVQAQFDRSKFDGETILKAAFGQAGAS
jgi:ABC-type sugar transport system ATPase subunit